MFPIRNSLKNSPTVMVPGIGCICFDEFHERSIESDLAFTLCLHLKRQRHRIWDEGVWWGLFDEFSSNSPGVWPPGWWSWAPLLDPWQSRSVSKLIADYRVNRVQTNVAWGTTTSSVVPCITPCMAVLCCIICSGRISEIWIFLHLIASGCSG